MRTVVRDGSRHLGRFVWARVERFRSHASVPATGRGWDRARLMSCRPLALVYGISNSEVTPLARASRAVCLALYVDSPSPLGWKSVGERGSPPLFGSRHPKQLWGQAIRPALPPLKDEPIARGSGIEALCGLETLEFLLSLRLKGEEIMQTFRIDRMRFRHTVHLT